MSDNGENGNVDEKTIYVRRVPREVWIAAKTGAAEKGITLREWVIEAIKEKADQ